MNRRAWMAVAAVAAIAVSACTPSESPGPSGPGETGAATPGSSPNGSPNGSPGPTGGTTTLRVQLPGPLSGRFAGYIAAQKLGYFSDDNLTVTFVPAANGSDAGGTLPASYYSPGASGPQFTIATLVPVLEAREHGSDLVNIAQIFQKSGTVALTWKSDAIADVCGLKGKRVGLWPKPADLELRSSLAACPLTPSQYTRVDAAPDVSGFLNRTIDATEGQAYDQVAQVLEATNPKTNAQYTTDDIATLAPTDRHATLQDGIFASAAWLAQPGNRDVAEAFIRASIRGWLYCRDHQEDCVQFTTAAVTGAGESHARWMINEVNGLIWPSPDGVGKLDPVLWQQTVSVAMGAGDLAKLPGLTAYDDTIVPDAVAILQGKDLTATDYQKGTVVVAAGGK
jgi:NitT/TauT family transport system substrate-binding protein